MKGVKNVAKTKKRSPAQYKKDMLEQKMLLGAINAERYKVFQQGENIGYSNAVAYMMWLLHTEYGFGKMRLTKLLAMHQQFCEDFITGAEKLGHTKITVDDFCEGLKDECGIIIDPKTGLFDVLNVEVKKGGEANTEDGEAAV